MELHTLDDWLNYQANISSHSIELGLERVSRVWGNMGAADFQCPVVVVGGTNGKGSTLRFLQQVYQHAGFRTAVYTSPHIERYNERICINGEYIEDNALIAAFRHIEQARGDTVLTYFEFGTLAALWCFYQAAPDIVLLEVGLGGRLDAVNILSHDLAIVTNVSLDHMDWLGDTIEEIAYEKAGIARTGKPLIYAEPKVPRSLSGHCTAVDAGLITVGTDYTINIYAENWNFESSLGSLKGLPHPNLPGHHQIYNCAAAIYAIQHLMPHLPVGSVDIEQSLAGLSLPGRFQKVRSKPDVILDVAHNHAASTALYRNLSNTGAKKICAVFAMQENREIASVVGDIHTLVTHWYVCPLNAVNSHHPEQIRQVILQLCPQREVTVCNSVADAMRQSLAGADAESVICVFGSFFTVSEAVQALRV